MDNLDKSSYALHCKFNSAHKTVRQYNWIVNEIKEESHPVAFDSIVSKVQSAFSIKPDNSEIPTREQILEGIRALLNDELVTQV